MDKIVKGKISWEKMDGSTEVEKKLNCYLTKQFIVSSNTPSDECLREAKFIISQLKNWFENGVVDFDYKNDMKD